MWNTAISALAPAVLLRGRTISSSLPPRGAVRPGGDANRRRAAERSEAVQGGLPLRGGRGLSWTRSEFGLVTVLLFVVTLSRSQLLRCYMICVRGVEGVT
jgi:hypothetical protein